MPLSTTLKTQLESNTLNVETLKSFLDELPVKEKGRAFEMIVAAIYEGNGYTVVVHGGKGDSGADLEIYAGGASKPLKLIQCKNHKRPLTKDDVRIELIKFETEAAEKYNCNNFEILSTSGFVDSAMGFQRFNILLSTLESLAPLIENHGKAQSGKPVLQLNGYNMDTFSKINSALSDSKRVCAIQATGTGKRYLAGQYVTERANKRVLFLSPSVLINEQQQKLIPWCNCEYKTYAGLLSSHKAGEMETGQFDCIVIDEFHRIGAKEWGSAFNALLELNPDAEIIGFTATPQRHSNGGTDMRDVLFGGKCVSEINLHDAIARRILQAPTYVTSLYDIDPYIDETKTRVVESSATEKERESLLKQIDSAHIDWSESKRVEHILAKHLTSIEGKYLIFCEDIDHMYSLVDQVRVWFRKAAQQNGSPRIKITDITIHSELKESEKQEAMLEFESPLGKSEIRLLFSVNMLNEGLHVKGVTRALLLRKTQSPIIHFQQIGRTLAADSEERPIIFDFVNNINSICASDFIDATNAAIESENMTRMSEGLCGVKDTKGFAAPKVYDEVLNLEKLSDKIQELVSSWSIGLIHLAEFKKEYGHCNVPAKHKVGEFNLGSWLRNRRAEFKKGNLSKQKVDKLNELGVAWDVAEHEWQNGLKELTEFKKEHGHCNVPRRYKIDEFNLGSWLSSRRAEFKKGSISQYKVDALNELGVAWDVAEHEWQNCLKELTEFKKEHGHCNVPNRCKVGEFNLGKWLSSRRTEFKKGNLSKQK
ncbi:Helicase associated domain protein, partial [Vibrio crassostreae]|uniref:Helicase associated domain protein n=1 Tax=Vibrio crassostreae TaxID=246167 RepID=UPI001B30EA10